MSEAGTYLPLKPTDGDQGDALFTILDAIIDQLDVHDHDGTDSAKIAVSGLTEASATLAAANWTATGSNGLYRQAVTITGGKNFNQTQFSVQDTDNNVVINPDIEKITNTSCYIYVNDNTLNLKVIFG